MSKTAVYNVRLDLRAVATLYNYYDSKGIPIRSISSLNRRVVEFVAQQMIRQFDAIEFVKTSDARNYLESKGVLKPLRNRAIVKGLQEESLQLDGLSVEYLERKSMSNISEDQIQAAKSILKTKTEAKTSGAILGLTPGTTKED